jgi:hypothetical protein
MFFPGSLLSERAMEDGFITKDNDDSYQLSYYGGLHHEQYAWKKRNLYVNGLLFLTGGHCTRYRIGTIPRCMFNFLIHPRVVDFNESHTSVIEILIVLKGLLYRVRSTIVQWLKLFIRDPYAIYNFGFFIKQRFSLKGGAR